MSVRVGDKALIVGDCVVCLVPSVCIMWCRHHHINYRHSFTSSDSGHGFIWELQTTYPVYGFKARLAAREDVGASVQDILE